MKKMQISETRVLRNVLFMGSFPVLPLNAELFRVAASATITDVFPARNAQRRDLSVPFPRIAPRKAESSSRLRDDKENAVISIENFYGACRERERERSGADARCALLFVL